VAASQNEVDVMQNTSNGSQNRKKVEQNKVSFQKLINSLKKAVFNSGREKLTRSKRDCYGKEGECNEEERSQQKQHA